MKEERLLTPLQLKKLTDFTKKNSYWIYDYINSTVLKDIGVMNPDYFITTIQNIFTQKTNTEINMHIANPHILPYLIFRFLSENGKITYTSLRVETIELSQLNKEAKTYYNYVRFSLKDNFLCIELMQSKIGGMPIDADIVKFTKMIPVNTSAFEEFIIKKEKDVDLIVSKDEYKKIKEAINSIF